VAITTGFFNKRPVMWAWLVLLLAAPIVLWILPGNFFDNGELIVCPSRAFFDIECLGCGMTRAVMHFHHFEFDDAVYFNRGVLLIYPALVVLWCLWVYQTSRKLGVWPFDKKPAV
jgi:hypothetical protein